MVRGGTKICFCSAPELDICPPTTRDRTVEIHGENGKNKHHGILL